MRTVCRLSARLGSCRWSLPGSALPPTLWGPRVSYLSPSPALTRQGAAWRPLCSQEAPWTWNRARCPWNQAVVVGAGLQLLARCHMSPAWSCRGVPFPLGPEPGPQAAAPCDPAVPTVSVWPGHTSFLFLPLSVSPMDKGLVPLLPAAVPHGPGAPLARHPSFVFRRSLPRGHLSPPGTARPRGCPGHACWTPSHTPEQENFELSGLGDISPPCVIGGLVEPQDRWAGTGRGPHPAF